MDLNAIPVTEDYENRTIVPPGPTEHTCGETADSGWGTHECHLRESHDGRHRCRCDQEWKRAEPEPVCAECDGTEKVPYFDGRTPQTRPCDCVIDGRPR